MRGLRPCAVVAAMVAAAAQGLAGGSGGAGPGDGGGGGGGGLGPSSGGMHVRSGGVGQGHVEEESAAPRWTLAASDGGRAVVGVAQSSLEYLFCPVPCWLRNVWAYLFVR